MKRFFMLLGIALFIASGSVFAEESVLIDFSTLTADADGENKATLLDFSSVAGTSYSDDEKSRMKSSLEISNWEVKLNSSAQTVITEKLSKTIPVVVKDNAKRYAGETVMGIRVHFPDGPYNANATIVPPFEIPTYATNPQDAGDDLNLERGAQFDGYGVIKNVGVIKSVSVNVYGRNFKHGLGVILENSMGREQFIFLKYLDFDGWRELTWKNPNYITEVRNREINRLPIYPSVSPTLKLKGVVITKDASQDGGDFISYIKDISVTYDKFARDDIESDIEDEEVWNILEDRELFKRNFELEKLGEKQVMRYLENLKMHQDTATATDDQGSSAEEAETTEATTE